MAKYNIKARPARTRSLTIEEQYQRYLDEFYVRIGRMHEKGIETPIDKYDSRPYMFEEFKLAWEQQKQASGKGVSTTNVRREVISQQLFFTTIKEAREIKQEARRLSILKENGREYTIEELRTNVSGRVLSAINIALKEDGVASGYERAEWIGKVIFGSE